MRWAANGRIDHRQHSAGWTGGVGGEALPRRGRRPRRGTRGGQVNRHGAERGGGHAIDPLRPSYEFCTFVRGRPAAQGVCWPHPPLSTTGAQGDDQTGAAAASGHLAGQPPREDPRLPPPADPASGSPRTGGSPRTRCAAGRPTAGGAAASMTRRDGDAAVAHCPPENRAKNTPQRAAMPLPAPPPRSLLPLRFPVSSCSPAPLAAPRAQAATVDVDDDDDDDKDVEDADCCEATSSCRDSRMAVSWSVWSLAQSDRDADGASSFFLAMCEPSSLTPRRGMASSSALSLDQKSQPPSGMARTSASVLTDSVK